MKRTALTGLLSLVAFVAAVLLASPAAAQTPPAAAQTPPAAAQTPPAATEAFSTGAPQTTIPVPAQQDTGGTEFTFVIGALLSDDAAGRGVLAITGPSETQPVFGARLGSYGARFGFEFGVEYSNGGLHWSMFDGTLASNVRTVYAEANVVISFLPGMVRPFATGGVGLHYFELEEIAGEREYKFGWNIGGGVRIVRGAFVIRGELRDHVTSLDSDTFGLGLEEFVAVNETFTIHNIELSFGIGVRF